MEGNGIRALVKNNDVAGMDKECPHRRKIAKLEVSELIVKELVLLGGFEIKRGHLEDKRDVFKAARGRKPQCSTLIFRSVGQHRILVVSEGLNEGPNKQ